MNPYANKFNQYQDTQIATASREQILIMLRRRHPFRAPGRLCH